MKEIEIDYKGTILRAALIREENPRIAIAQDRLAYLDMTNKVVHSIDILDINVPVSAAVTQPGYTDEQLRIYISDSNVPKTVMYHIQAIVRTILDKEADLVSDTEREFLIRFHN